MQIQLFAQAWRWIRRITLAAGALLTLILGMEFFRGFVLFYRFNRVWGWVYASVILLFLLLCVIYVFKRAVRYPHALISPECPPLPEASHKQKTRYCRYLIRYLRRLAHNHRLSADDRDALLAQADEIQDVLKHHPLHDDLTRTIQHTESAVLPAALKSLKTLAEKEIRRSVRDVMLGVTLSPYHSVDLLIVLYRNTAMVFRVADVYETRPTLRAHAFILRDVIRVVATLNFLYVGRNLIENLFAFLPWVGRVAEDVGQGIGAGLFTSAAGHAAIDRCASYRGWEKQLAVESLAAQTRDFLRDVKNIFTKDVLPDIRSRLLSEAPAQEAEQPGFWENCVKGINNAFDATIKTAAQVVSIPLRSQPSEAPAHSSIDRDESSSERTRRRRSTHRTGRPHVVPRVVRTFGQRLKYTMGLNRWLDK